MIYKFRRMSRYALLVCIDFILLLGAWELAFYINGTHLTSLNGGSPELLFILLMVAVQIVAFAATKLYRISLSTVSLELVYKGGIAFVIGNVFAILVILTQFEEQYDVVKLLIPYWSLSVVLIFSYRIIWRMTHGYNMTLSNHVTLPRALMYGAGEVADQLLRLYRKDSLEFKVIGLLDDDARKHQSMIHGLTVFGGIDQLEDAIRSQNIAVVIIATTKIDQKRMNEIVEITAKNDVAIKIIPSMFEMESYNRSLTDIRDLEVEDLLGRDPVEIDRQPIFELIRGKRVLVTGAGGSIGSEIAAQVMSFDPKRLIILDIDETEIHNLSLKLNNYQRAFCEHIIPVVCDVRDGAKIDRIMAQYRPEIVFHAAAYKHVPLMEHFPEEAIQTNISGTYHVFKSAVAYEAERCILISTDKAVNPTNVMGATKRMAELIASTLSNEKTRIVGVRFGNVLGSRGSMLPLFMDQIRNGLPITVTHKDIIRYFMTIPEAVSLVFLAGAVAKGGEVMVLDMGEPVRIYDFAQKLLRKFGDGRSKIVITGLRQGEKLYEELLTDEDDVIATDYKKIFKAKVNGRLDPLVMERFVHNIPKSDVSKVLYDIRTLVPGFTNGRFEGEQEGQNIRAMFT